MRFWPLSILLRKKWKRSAGLWSAIVQTQLDPHVSGQSLPHWTGIACSNRLSGTSQTHPDGYFEDHQLAQIGKSEKHCQAASGSFIPVLE
jgi:hypothetical protein